MKLKQSALFLLIFLSACASAPNPVCQTLPPELTFEPINPNGFFCVEPKDAPPGKCEIWGIYSETLDTMGRNFSACKLRLNRIYDSFGNE